MAVAPIIRTVPVLPCEQHPQLPKMLAPPSSTAPTCLHTFPDAPLNSLRSAKLSLVQKLLLSTLCKRVHRCRSPSLAPICRHASHENLFPKALSIYARIYFSGTHLLHISTSPPLYLTCSSTNEKSINLQVWQCLPPDSSASKSTFTAPFWVLAETGRKTSNSSLDSCFTPLESISTQSPALRCHVVSWPSG